MTYDGDSKAFRVYTTMEMTLAAERVKYLYEQMGEPKYVVAVGACPTGKGPFYDSYAIVEIDEYVPVDIYIPGCPPRPEAIIYGMMKLQEKIVKERRLGVKK